MGWSFQEGNYEGVYSQSANSIENNNYIFSNKDRNGNIIVNYLIKNVPKYIQHTKKWLIKSDRQYFPCRITITKGTILLIRMNSIKCI